MTGRHGKREGAWRFSTGMTPIKTSARNEQNGVPRKATSNSATQEGGRNLGNGVGEENMGADKKRGRGGKARWCQAPSGRSPERMRDQGDRGRGLARSSGESSQSVAALKK